MTALWVTTKNMASTVVKDGFVKPSELCVVAAAAACTANGIS
jgi:D-xylose transport system substrate-binding protein